MNPYTILNLDRNCTKNDIKVAYRKLALKYHPDKASGDKNIAEEKFKEISEAYQILIDDERRKLYDSTGNMDNIFLDADELFENFFNEFDPELKVFMMSAYKNFNNAMDKTDDKSFLKVISNMDTRSLINDSTRLLTEYFLSNTKQAQKINVKTHDNLREDIILESHQLTKFNNIQLSINDYFIKESYNLKIINTNDESSNYILSTEYKDHKIKYLDKIYTISFIDKDHKILKRTNGYDLVANLPIGIEDYKNGFLFIFNFLSNIFLQVGQFKTFLTNCSHSNFLFL